MRMIACMSPVTDGTLRVLGMDPASDGPRIRGRIGLVPQEDTLDLELTVLDNLMVYGRYFDLPRKVIRERAERLLEFAQLSDRANDKVDPLSGGMKRRLTIARSLISEPGAADPRRADHRPRPPGAPPPVGPALPPEATRCDAGHHDPLHGRGRTAVRPAGRDGPRSFRRRGHAARADRPVLDPRGARAALRPRRDTEPWPHEPQTGWPTGSRSSRTGCCSTPTTATTALRRGPRAGDSTPESALVRRSTLEDVFLRLTGRTLVD